MAIHTGMIPPAATPPRTRVMKSTVRLGARADASRHSARTATATLITTALPKASPVGPRNGWLRPKGSANAEDSSATTLTDVAKSDAMVVMSGSRRRVARAPENPHRERMNSNMDLSRYMGGGDCAVWRAMVGAAQALLSIERQLST